MTQCLLLVVFAYRSFNRSQHGEWKLVLDVKILFLAVDQASWGRAVLRALFHSTRSDHVN